MTRRRRSNNGFKSENIVSLARALTVNLATEEGEGDEVTRCGTENTGEIFRRLMSYVFGY